MPMVTKVSNNLLFPIVIQLIGTTLVFNKDDTLTVSEVENYYTLTFKLMVVYMYMHMFVVHRIILEFLFV